MTASFLAGRCLTAGAYYSRSLAKQIKAWTEEISFNEVLFYCSSMGQYLGSLGNIQSRVIVDLVDLDSEKWSDYSERSNGFRKWLYKTESRRVAMLEQYCLSKADHVWLVTDAERSLCEKRHGEFGAQTLRNGVDIDYFRSDEVHEEGYKTLKRGSPQLVFTGVLNYRPNFEGMLWFCQNVWPMIRQRWTNATLDIVGRDPTAEVSKLSKLAGVKVVGPVEDVRPYLLAADIAIAPLQVARGLQNKILEALAMGRPVIASRCAAEGIGECRGLTVADSVETWNDRLEDLLRDSGSLEKIGKDSRKFVVSNFSWEAQLKPLRTLFEPIQDCPERIVTLL